jgi:hypothetical protein
MISSSMDVKGGLSNGPMPLSCGSIELVGRLITPAVASDLPSADAFPVNALELPTTLSVVCISIGLSLCLERKLVSKMFSLVNCAGPVKGPGSMPRPESFIPCVTNQPTMFALMLRTSACSYLWAYDARLLQ